MKDINIKFNVNSVNGDIGIVTGKYVVQQSIANLVKTITGERPYKPEIGSGINKLLGEPLSNVNAALIKEQLKQMINTYEDRAEIIDITSLINNEQQCYKMTLSYTIVNSEEIVTQDLNLTLIN